MSLLGTLESLRVPEIFSLLQQLRKTGVLSIVAPECERSFVFSEGDIVSAMSHEESKRLGHYLVRLGLILHHDLEELFANRFTKENCFGQRMLESGRLDETDLHRAVKAQVQDLFGEVSRWEEAAFHFDENELPFGVPEDRLISTQSLVLNAARMTDEHLQARALFPDPGIVIEPVERTVPRSLVEEELQVMGAVDGTRSIDQVIIDCGVDPPKAATAIQDMLEIGLLRPKGGPARREGGIRAPDFRWLPVSPGVPPALVAVFGRSVGEQKEGLVDVLAREPLLVAKLVKSLTLNNVDVSRDDIGLARIVDLLGLYTLRCSLIPEAVRGLFFPPKQWFWKDLWEHSYYCGQLARRLAETTRYRHPEEAQVAGLLHNMGAFLLLHQDPERYQQVVSESLRRHEDLESLERAQFGSSHPELAAEIARQWSFPSTLQLVVESHHRVDPSTVHPLLHLVSAADGVIREQGFPLGYHEGDAEQLERSLTRLDTSRREVVSIFRELRRGATPGLSPTPPTQQTREEQPTR